MFDPQKLRVLAGNHDDYDAIPDFEEFFLGDFGTVPGTDDKVFFVRGAWSIDKEYRIPGVSWWEQEQLSWKQANECLDLYESLKNKVEVVLSHDCPIPVANSILKHYPQETLTGKLLYEMAKIHEPEAWYFGHYHVCWQKRMGRTHYRCLNINEAVTIEV